MHLGCVPWVDSLSPAAEDVAICHFYHNVLENLSDKDPTRHLHTQLPAVYAKSEPGSALRLATEAISYAASTKLAREPARIAKERYVQATRAVRTALYDAREAMSDQTLYAVLLLCGYEVSFIPSVAYSNPQLTTTQDHYVGFTCTTGMELSCRRSCGSRET